jgi:hemerythrin superfamily protein
MADKESSTNDNASDGVDALQLLESQHRAVEKLFQSIPVGGDAKDVQPTVLQIVDKLTMHTVLEERHFYPAVRAGDTEDLIDDAFEDHREMKELCLQLLDLQPDDDGYSAQVDELQGIVEEHVSIEESELFPLVRDLLSASELEDLGQQMVASMAELEEEGSPRARLIGEATTRPLA